MKDSVPARSKPLVSAPVDGTPVLVSTDMISMLRTMVMGVLICWPMACARPDHDNPDAILSGARETEQLPEANAHPRLDSIGCTPSSPAVVELRGILVSSERLGPPGWGETPQQDER